MIKKIPKKPKLLRYVLDFFFEDVYNLEYGYKDLNPPRSRSGGENNLVSLIQSLLIIQNLATS